MIGILYWGLVGVVILLGFVQHLRRELVWQNASLNNDLLISEAWRRKLVVELREACGWLEDETDGTLDDRIAFWRQLALLSESCLDHRVLACDP